MGWYVHYELDIQDNIDWDDEEMMDALADINCNFLYLRDMGSVRIILSVYTHHTIEEVLDIICKKYQCSIFYREYRTREWTRFCAY